MFGQSNQSPEKKRKQMFDLLMKVNNNELDEEFQIAHEMMDRNPSMKFDE